MEVLKMSLTEGNTNTFPHVFIVLRDNYINRMTIRISKGFMTCV